MSNSALFLAATLIWGSTWYAITFQLGAVAPEASVAYRFALAALLLGAWCRATGRSLRFPARTHGWIAAQATFLFGLNYIAVYRAEQHVTSGLVAVLFSTIVFFNPVGARLFFGTPLTMRTLAGATVGVGGVALIFLPELVAARSGGTTAAGIAYGLGATVLACGGNMLAVRNQNAGIPIFSGTAWGMAYGAAVAAAVASTQGVAWSVDLRPAYVGSLLYLAVFGSIAAFGAYLTLIQRLGAGPASYVGVATPVVAMLLSTLLEGYRWTPLAVAGVALAIAGYVLVLRPTRKRGRPISPA
ncbi:MAG: DMT family transporter [Betaproteobacteria bacterium]